MHDGGFLVATKDGIKHSFFKVEFQGIILGDCVGNGGG